MTDFPLQLVQVTPLFVNSISRYAQGWESRTYLATAGPAVQTWVTNLICYIPFALPFAYPCKRVWWLNGSTASSNVDMGIFSGSGVQLFSTGSVAQSGASVMQYVAADILLTPGTYYVAWSCNGTTNRANTSAATAIQGRLMGLIEQVAFPLPTSMTGVVWGRAFGAPFCGLTRTASGF